MANAKVKLIRILEILQDTDEKHPLTAPQIGEKLKHYGIEAERKSICRDINILIDDLGYDIISPKLGERHGYYMASRDFEDWELKILLDAVCSSKFLTKESADKLTKKIIVLANNESAKLLKTTLPIKSELKGRNVSTKRNIEEVLRAIKYNKQIKFQYSYTDTDMQNKLRRDGLYYVVNPYALIWQNEQYYLIGNYDKYNDLSYYRLDRMKNLDTTGSASKPATDILGANADIRIKEYVKTSLYHYGGEKIRLELFVQGYMVDDLVDYFGSELIFREQDDGYLVTIDVMDSEGLYYWLLQYEKHVKVISPTSVKDKLLEKVKGILELYGDGQND